MKHQIKFAIATLRIGTIVLTLIGFTLLILFFIRSLLIYKLHDLPIFELVFVPISIYVLLLAVGVEFVTRGIIRRKFWAWVAGLCIFSFYLLGPFFPFGVIGLWSLLVKGSRAEFGIGIPPSKS